MPVFPTVPGHPDYSSIGVNKWIPQIWSGKLIEKFYQQTFLSEITNNIYEGEIKNQGDKVIIRTTPTMNIKDYVKGQKITYDQPTAQNIELLVDKAKIFAAQLDNIDELQMDIPAFNEWSKDATQQMKIAIERDFLADIVGLGSAYNSGETAGFLSANIDLGSAANPLTAVTGTSNGDDVNTVELFIRAAQCLDEKDRPEDGRWIMIPTMLAQRMKLDSNLKSVFVTGDDKSPFRTGKIGGIDRFTIYQSNLLPVVNGNVYCPFGDKKSTCFVTQMTNVEKLDKLESTFGKAIRGLNVYGYKVIDDLGLGCIVLQNA